MEFNEKLQELRKAKKLTQEELAEALFVSRAAVSKWESGRGYPNIETLKDISAFFSVSIDYLLSGEKLLSISQKENKTNISSLCGLMFGITDLFSLVLVILPLYPNTVDGFVYSVNLFHFSDIKPVYLLLHWVMVALLFLSGVFKLILAKTNAVKSSKALAMFSVTVNILIVIFFALMHEAYPVTAATMLLTAKGLLLLKNKDF